MDAALAMEIVSASDNEAKQLMCIFRIVSLAQLTYDKHLYLFNIVGKSVPWLYVGLPSWGDCICHY